MNINKPFSPRLEESFEEYRKTPEYNKEVEQRMRTLEVFGIFPSFAEALAKDSVDIGIKVSELLSVKDKIIAENDSLQQGFNELDHKRIDLITSNGNKASNDDSYSSNKVA